MRLVKIGILSLLLGASVVFPQPDAFDAALEPYRQGNFPATVAACTRLLETARDNWQLRAELLLLRSSANRLLGRQETAASDLSAAVGNARKSGIPALIARTLVAQANALIAAENKGAAEVLAEAEKLAGTLSDRRVAAELHTTQGDLAAAQDRHEEAARKYLTAAADARAERRQLLAARAYTAAAQSFSRTRDLPSAVEALAGASSAAHDAPKGFERDTELIRMAAAAISLLPHLGKQSPAARIAQEALQEASESAERQQQWVNASHAWGNLARLREIAGTRPSALEALRKAKDFARRAGGPDPLYRWQWASARMMADPAQTAEAEAEYARAVDNLQSVRTVASSSLPSFRDTEGRLYFEYVDLLLREAARKNADEQKLLGTARETIEQFKRAELRDYFQDECVEDLQERAADIEQISADALVIYPVPLPDRLELILGSSRSGLHRIGVPVSADVLAAQVRNFRSLLEKRTTNEYRVPARQLHEWLIEPILRHPAIQGVSTLVFVPEGVLRLIPFSALHDGRDFLISRFAVVISPGLTVADPRPMAPMSMQVLAGGLTSHHSGMADLPGVATELKSLASSFDTKILLDRSFTSRELERQLTRGRYGAVHIASHAVVSADADESYLLAYDGKLTMDRLGQIISSARFGDRPVELIMLSGCETAVGDDRAALGLAGVALRAGAKSAVATLWHVNDESTAELTGRFYQLLASPRMSRAKALQEAQKELLRHTWYSHPGYWSPFLLLNNWL